mmetsp:Transcript_8779/g.22111  ORF Transcript_8779/g.22111 Transcript_8779/m.22111 type:complete len:232 (-) Transcript_8779:231-926(-)
MRIVVPQPSADPGGRSMMSYPLASFLCRPAATLASTMAAAFSAFALARSTITRSGYVPSPAPLFMPRTTPAVASVAGGALQGACTYLFGRRATSGTHCRTYAPVGSWCELEGDMVKFHWSMPLLPAFCHIMLLMAKSASTRFSWNHNAPCTQWMLRYSVRNAAHTMRTLCCIQPEDRSSRMPASTRGYPVRPSRHRRSGVWSSGAVVVTSIAVAAARSSCSAASLLHRIPA